MDDIYTYIQNLQKHDNSNNNSHVFDSPLVDLIGHMSIDNAAIVSTFSWGGGPTSMAQDL